MASLKETLELRVAKEKAVSELGAVLRTYPRLPNGKITDDARLSSSYREHKAAYARAFAELREFNTWFVKQFRT